jgi:hypothetical protein
MTSMVWSIEGALMFYWLYEIPILLVVGLFALLFVGLCSIGIIFVSPIIAPWFQDNQRLNEVLGDYLQYFGVIYGLLLGLLAVATYQNHTDVGCRERGIVVCGSVPGH